MKVWLILWDGFMAALKADDNQAGKATSKTIDLCVEDELCDCHSLEYSYISLPFGLRCVSDDEAESDGQLIGLDTSS